MKSSRIKIIRDRQINLRLLQGRTIAIIGFGSQGRAQALNLRDSGFRPIIGLPVKSRSRKIARRDGFAVMTPLKAVKQADIVAILIPDHKHRELFDKELYQVMTAGQTYIFAHALSVHFNLINQPEEVDYILVAPHGPGIRLRERYLAGQAVTAFIGKTEKSSKQSLRLAAAYAKAIGCLSQGLIETTFAHEAVGDIFGEQAILCGGLSALLKAGFNTLVKAGIPSENAYLECVYQLDLIIDLIKKYGIDGMYQRISTTAAYGGLMAESKIINDKSKKAMISLLKQIEDGRFTAGLMDDYNNSFKKFNQQRKKSHSLALDEMARYFNAVFNR